MNKERFTADLKTVTFCILVEFNVSMQIGFRLHIIMCNNVRFHLIVVTSYPLKNQVCPWCAET